MSKLLGEISKNTMERIRVIKTSYKGYDFIDLRVYYQDEKGEWKPTKKGLTVAPDKVGELLTIIKKAERGKHNQEGSG